MVVCAWTMVVCGTAEGESWENGENSYYGGGESWENVENSRGGGGD